MLVERLSGKEFLPVRGIGMTTKQKGSGTGSNKPEDERMCAICDSAVDSNSIKVRSRGEIVEVCSEECAVKAKEGHV